MITVTFHCGGCSAKAEGTSNVKQTFHGITGRPHGFGSYVEEKPSTKAPEGWVAFDIIGATYCPKCAEEIWPEGEADDS